MLKKVLVVAALLCVMLPFAAQDKEGKWNIELGGWFTRPLGLDTTYAYGFKVTGTTVGVNFAQKPYSIGNEFRWQPTFKLAYDSGSLDFWIDYTTYDQTSFSVAPGTDNQIYLNPTLVNGAYYFGYATSAGASMRTSYTNWNFNMGHTFHPTDKWALMVFGGLRYLRLENDLHVDYIDTSDLNNWGYDLGTDSVRIRANMTGWGLNFGLQSNYVLGKRFEVGTGLQVSMLRTTNDVDQYEILNANYSGTVYSYGMTGVNSSQQRVTPALEMYAEAKFNFNEAWYAKFGYRFDFIKDGFGFDYANTPDLSGGAMYGIPTGGYYPTSKDVTFDGLYFSIGYKF